MKYRTIIKDAEFEKEYSRIEADIKKADEFLEAIEWSLCRNPFIGKRISPKYGLWMVSTDPALDFPQLTLYYTFDKDNVIFLSIEES